MHFTHFQCTSNARLHRICIFAEEIPSISDYIVRLVFFTDSTCSRSRRRSAHVRPQWDLWRVNTSLLADEIFCKGISDSCNGILEPHSLSLHQKWNIFKQGVRNCAIEESARFSFLKRFHGRELTRTLVGLHELEAVSPRSRVEEIGIVKGQLHQHVTEKYHGALIRSRTD